MKSKVLLDRQQGLAVNHKKGPLLIVAGAGTGKTTVITERIKKLILEDGVVPSKILALTFTEKAAKEMEERVDVALPYGYTQMWISTFHSFCDRILRAESIHIGLNPSYKLMTQAESILFLRNNIFKFNLKYFRPLGNPNKFLEAMVSHFSRLADEDVTPDQYIKWAKKLKAATSEEKEEKEKYLELANAFKTYQELKATMGMMDFSDLITNTLRLFRERKTILKNYQEQFEYVLVDEFQDTNFAQNELAILLCGKDKNITVVGDDDQSIYRFRGSSVSNMIQFRQHFKNAKIIPLVNNYRSTEEILERSYNLIQFNNPDRLEAKEKIDKKLRSMRNKKGESIEFIYKDRVENEADETAKKIVQLVKKNKYSYKDIAILVRANDHSEPFIRAFERHKIPFQFLGPGRLFQQDEIKDLISYLKVLYNFEDSPSLYRVLNMPYLKLEGIEISILLNNAKKNNYTLFEMMEKIDETSLNPKAKEKLTEFVKMVKRHLDLVPKETAGQILYYFLSDTGIIQELVNAKTQKEEKTAKNYAKFFDKLKTYETEHKTSSVYDVVDWIDLSMQMGESPLAGDLDWSENNAVNILTIHSSKGLEFPVVFLVNLVAQRFPTRERREGIPIPKPLIKEILSTGDYHLQEERRLFYVGMTRAKDLLFLTAAGYYGEGKKERKISPFVYESLGEEEVKKILNTDSVAEQITLPFLEDYAPREKPKEEERHSNGVITYLSYSQIQTFDMCPLHYKLKYILKIPTPPSPAQSFGISIHSSLRNLCEEITKKEKLDNKKIVDILKNNWIKEGYSSKLHEEKSFEKAEKIILDYYKNNLSKGNPPIAMETPFNFNLENLKVGGRIDRIDELDGTKIEIIDYKTGENIPEQKKVDNDLQLTFYALAATKVKDKPLNRKPDDIILSLLYIEKDKKITTVRTKEQLEQAEEFIKEKVKEISESDFKCSHSIFCNNCEYKMLCSSN